MKYLVVWVETKAYQSKKVYYQGWWHQYGEPLYSPERKNAFRMSKSGAIKACKRLADPKIWGGINPIIEPY